jgi:hypothetical protein
MLTNHDIFSYDSDLILFIIKTCLAIVLLILIKRKSFLPAFIIATFISVLAGVSFFVRFIGKNVPAFIPNDVYPFWLLMNFTASIFIGYLFYFFLAQHPYRQMIRNKS